MTSSWMIGTQKRLQIKLNTQDLLALWRRLYASHWVSLDSKLCWCWLLNWYKVLDLQFVNADVLPKSVDFITFSNTWWLSPSIPIPKFAGAECLAGAPLHPFEDGHAASWAGRGLWELPTVRTDKGWTSSTEATWNDTVCLFPSAKEDPGSLCVVSEWILFVLESSALALAFLHRSSH